MRRILNKVLTYLILSLSIICITTLASSCGKRVPPLPPVERVAQRVLLEGSQRGDVVTLLWQMPARNASADSVLNISRVEIYRLAEPLTSPQILTEEDFASLSTLIDSVEFQPADFGNKIFTYQDRLQILGQPIRLRYAIRFVNSSGQKAGFSNFFLFEPTAKIPLPPRSINSEISADAVNIDWTAPEENIDGSRPPAILGYNIYKSSVEEPNVKMLNTQPITVTKYADNFFKFGAAYKYFVRAVTVGAGGLPIESADSDIIEVTPKDTFKPNAPDNITIAATPESVSLFFAQNPESDIAGYKVYRTTDPNLPKEKWDVITPEPITRNTFQDRQVKSGVTYYYYIVAIDTAGNSSELSEVVSETVP